MAEERLSFKQVVKDIQPELPIGEAVLVDTGAANRHNTIPIFPNQRPDPDLCRMLRSLERQN